MVILTNCIAQVLSCGGYSQSEMNDVVLPSPRGAIGQPIGDIFTLA